VNCTGQCCGPQHFFQNWIHYFFRFGCLSILLYVLWNLYDTTTVFNTGSHKYRYVSYLRIHNTRPATAWYPHLAQVPVLNMDIYCNCSMHMQKDDRYLYQQLLGLHKGLGTAYCMPGYKHINTKKFTLKYASAARSK
jgi:hypothetical protein